MFFADVSGGAPQLKSDCGARSCQRVFWKLRWCVVVDGPVAAVVARSSSSGLVAQTIRIVPVCAAQYWPVCLPNQIVQPWWRGAVGQTGRSFPGCGTTPAPGPGRAVGLVHRGRARGRRILSMTVTPRSSSGAGPGTARSRWKRWPERPAGAAAVDERGDEHRSPRLVVEFAEETLREVGA